MTIEIEVPDGESASLDFKSCFDPESKQDWCELIKDMVAMSNSGGGTIIVGVDALGTGTTVSARPNYNPGGVLNVDYYGKGTFRIPTDGTGIVNAPSVVANPATGAVTYLKNSMPQGGTLTIRTASSGSRPEAASGGSGREGRFVEMSVSDTGAGM